jgi:phosphoribosylformylglycinamidine synthase
VTGGNVSFYNENPNGAIDPTPLVVMVGQIDAEEHITTQWFKRAGDTICLLDGGQDDALGGLGGSEYLRRVHGLKTGAAPAMDLAREKALQDCCLAAIRAGVVHSAHDCSEGGLAVALAECCISAPVERLSSAEAAVGARIQLTGLGDDQRDDVLLFGERQSRVIVSVAPDDVAALKAIADAHDVKVTTIGTTGGEALLIERGKRVVAGAPVGELRAAWLNGLPEALGAGEGSMYDE